MHAESHPSASHESSDIGLASGFLRSSRVLSDSAALIHDGCTWTYAEVLDEARRWATRLREHRTPGRMQVVGIFTHKGPTEHVGKLAALLAGAIFVPLNPKFPAERLAEMMAQSGVTSIIVDNEAAKGLHAVFERLEEKPLVLLPDGLKKPHRHRLMSTILDAVDLTQATPLPLHEIADPSALDVAYIMFTSGSSGRPKGVPISHGNLRAYLDSSVRRHDFAHADVFALTFDSTFDLSIFGPFVAWEAGACAITMKPHEISSPLDFINENGVTVWLSVPSVAKTLISSGALSPRSLPGLRYSLFCGEALPEYVASAWQEAACNSAVINMYGPTETTISVSEFIWDSETSPKQCVNGLVPIGDLYANHDALIVDNNGREVAKGERGELCIAGPQVFSGYLDDTDRNSPSFLLHKTELGETKKYYKTGDTCQTLDDGTIVYLARNDHQVKISGYRIELGDVEAALRRVGAGDAVAVPWPPRDPRFLIAAVTGVSLKLDMIAAILPPHMVPQRTLTLDEMPLNANGKVDRNRVVERLTHLMSPTRDNRSPLSLDDVKKLVAHALGERLSDIADDAQLHDPPSWDSLGHNAVVAALETRLSTHIGPEHDHMLRSVQGILEFVQGRATSRRVNRSLRGLLVTETAITHNDIANGQLYYCGYSLTDLLEHATFEQVAYLLLNRELPDSSQSLAFRGELAGRREVSSTVMDVLDLCVGVNAHPVAAVATAISFLGSEISGFRKGLHLQSVEDAAEAGLNLIAQLPTLTSAYHRLRLGKPPIAPQAHLSHIENILHMFDVPMTELNIEAITKDFIIHADNGPTASTFACMVANSAYTTVHAAVATAANVFSGARHGYASETAYGQLVSLDGPEEVRSYIARRLDNGELVDGIGHAIFGRTGDPRLAPYREIATSVATNVGNIVGLEKATMMYNTARAKKDGAQPNYDLFGGLLYESLGLPIDLSAPLHVCFRVVGWVAHILEERETGQPLVRPDARYVGASARPVPTEPFLNASMERGLRE